MFLSSIPDEKETISILPKKQLFYFIYSCIWWRVIIWQKLISDKESSNFLLLFSRTKVCTIIIDKLNLIIILFLGIVMHSSSNKRLIIDTSKSASNYVTIGSPNNANSTHKYTPKEQNKPE